MTKDGKRMNKRKITIGSTLMLLMPAVVSTFNITFFVASEYYNARLGNFEELESEYEKFSEVSSIVDKYFVGEYDKEEMMDAALKGYINGMGDQWSSYLTEEEYQAVLEQREGTYAGVGITISASADGQTFTVTAVAEDGPAEKAGIQVLDQLVAVDGESIAGMSYDDRNNKVHGEPGSQVVLTILRDGRQTEYAIEREEVQTSGVKAQMLDGNIGLIRIESFSTNVDQEFSQKLQQLLDEGAQGLVFDVRFNPGGFVEVLVNMLDELLPKGTIISIADKDGNSTNYTSDEEQVELPMAVLTNEYSISAAEFFAACREWASSQTKKWKWPPKSWPMSIRCSPKRTTSCRRRWRRSGSRSPGLETGDSFEDEEDRPAAAGRSFCNFPLCCIPGPAPT